MLSAFNSKILKSRLSKLGLKANLAFGASCCERLLPNYLAFTRETGWGDILPLRRGLDLIWDYLLEKQYDPDEIKEIITTCESIAPDSDDFHSIYSTSAQEACFSVCELLDYLLDNDVQKIVQIATYATDTVDLYVQVTENYNPNLPDIENKILTHPLMQRELEEQENNLKSIEAANKIDEKFISLIKNSWVNKGKSNIDLL